MGTCSLRLREIDIGPPKDQRKMRFCEGFLEGAFLVSSIFFMFHKLFTTETTSVGPFLFKPDIDESTDRFRQASSSQGAIGS